MKAVVAKHPTPKIMKETKKLSRTNWEKGKQKESLAKEIDNWDNGGGNEIDSKDLVTLSEFLNLVGIPYNTLRQYIKGDKEKQRTICKSSDRYPLIKKKEKEFVAQVLARLDRTNDVATLPEAIDMVQQLDPYLYLQQSRWDFKRTVQKNHPNLLRSKLRVVQSTTSKKSAVTVMQQYH